MRTTLRRLALLAAVTAFATGAVAGPAHAVATDQASTGISRHWDDDDDDDDDDWCLIWFLCHDD